MSKKRKKKKKKAGTAGAARAQLAEKSDPEPAPKADPAPEPDPAPDPQPGPAPEARSDPRDEDPIDRDPTPLPAPRSYADLDSEPIAIPKPAVEAAAPVAELEVPPTREVRARTETAALPVPPPPFGFLKGAVLGLVLLLPLAALACYLLARIGIGDPDTSYTQVISFVAVFGGLPGILSAGGVGRVAARTAVAPRRGGTGWSILVSAAACTVIGAGVVILSVVPLGEVPTTSERWLWITGFGGGAGLMCGIMIGLWVSYGSPQRT